MWGAEVCFHTFAFNQQKLRVCDEKLIMYNAGCQIIDIIYFNFRSVVGFCKFFKNLKEKELMKNDDNLIHSPM